jgi:hypothetical protein
MVKTSYVCRTNKHARALSNRLQPFKYLNGFSAILLCGFLSRFFICHEGFIDDKKCPLSIKIKGGWLINFAVKTALLSI